MPQSKPTLHMLCGKIASGKSTLAARIAEEHQAVLVAEDEWLSTLFVHEIVKPSDFMRCSAKLRRSMGPHISALLEAGVSVVMDFQANTVESRNWMRGIFEASESAHQLHVLDVPDEVCLARLRERNARGKHAFSATEAQFRQISKHYEAPSLDEGFDLVVHTGNSE